MPAVKKCGPKGKKSCGPKVKSGPCLTDNFLNDLTAHKTTVLTLMAAVLGLGVLFSMMLGVSAAQF